MRGKYKINKNIYLSIGLVLFVLCITGATYAYFALTASNNSLIGTTGKATLTLTVNKIAPTTQSTNLVPQLESTLGDAISSDYNCVDEYNNVICHVYKATISNNKKATVELKGLISFDYITDSEYELEDKMPNLKWRRITDATTLGESTTYRALSREQLFEESKVLAQEETVDYYFVVWVDETGESQSDGGMFRVNINFKSDDGSGLSSTIRPNMVEYIQGLYNDGSALTTVNIEGNSALPTVSLNATQGIMLDNNGEYRYYGANPNNYVEFNNELWRIISISNIKKNAEDTASEMRLKIIRKSHSQPVRWSESISTINNGLGVNDWSKSGLMSVLNTIYYNKTSGSCYGDGFCNATIDGLGEKARSLIDDAYWNLGGTIATTEIPVPSVNHMYNYERGTNVSDCSTGDDGACPRAIGWTGKVALMYSSDYGYASDLSVCQKKPLYYGYDLDSSSFTLDTCLTTNWLIDATTLQTGAWTLTSWGTSDYPYGVTYIGPTSNINNGYIAPASHLYSTRPVVYLKADVSVADGIGTISNPYKLSRW